MDAEKYCPKCFKKFGSAFPKCPDDGTALVALSQRDLTGDEIDGRYKILEKLGAGGMGVVYKAEQHLIGRIVALKVLKREIVSDESFVKRFLIEAKATASLENENTVTLHDFGVTGDGLLYYTMEYLQGRNLAKVVKQEGPIDYRRAAGLILQAGRSLEEAHAKKILHRDLKPDNLFVLKRGEREFLKVLDFGIAKLVGDTTFGSPTGDRIPGTAEYMSPEQATRDQVSPASDLYSLGIVLYEMVSGSPPFKGETPVETLLKQVTDPPPPLAERNPDVQVPEGLQLFLDRALKKSPTERFQSATEFREALKDAVGGPASGEVSTTARGLPVSGVKSVTQAYAGIPSDAVKVEGQGPAGETGLPSTAKQRPSALAEAALAGESVPNGAPDAGEESEPEGVSDPVAAIGETNDKDRPRNLDGRRLLLGGIAAALVLIALLFYLPSIGGRTGTDSDVRAPTGGRNTEQHFADVREHDGVSPSPVPIALPPLKRDAEKVGADVRPQEVDTGGRQVADLRSLPPEVTVDLRPSDMQPRFDGGADRVSEVQAAPEVSMPEVRSPAEESKPKTVHPPKQAKDKRRKKTQAKDSGGTKAEKPPPVLNDDDSDEDDFENEKYLPE